ncbi:MAG TPA: MBL fold metallo-hydrolase [Thermoplasmata archaeon]|nr:MBL fold metallo-hydrolase [Thermoplasmata archaeon]
MRVAVLNSGSNGNATLVIDGDRALLVDCGLSARRCLQRAGDVAGEFSLEAILVTHEHTDHVSGVGPLARRLGVAVHATSTTRRAAGRRLEGIRFLPVEPMSPFRIGPFEVTPLPLLHDAADPVGFHIRSGGTGITLATDLGIVTDDLMAYLERSDAVVLEANHDVEMLMAGHYPRPLKARIMGPLGHLSNDDSAATIARCAPRIAFLAHLSRDNNTSDLALGTVRREAEERGIDVEIIVTSRERATPLVDVH